RAGELTPALELAEPGAEAPALVLPPELGQDLRADGVHDVLGLVEEGGGRFVVPLGLRGAEVALERAVAPADVGHAGLERGAVLRAAPRRLGGEVEVALPDGLAIGVRPALVELAVGAHRHAVHRMGTPSRRRRQACPPERFAAIGGAPGGPA